MTLKPLLAVSVVLAALSSAPAWSLDFDSRDPLAGFASDMSRMEKPAVAPVRARVVPKAAAGPARLAPVQDDDADTQRLEAIFAKIKAGQPISAADKAWAKEGFKKALGEIQGPEGRAEIMKAFKKKNASLPEGERLSDEELGAVVEAFIEQAAQIVEALLQVLETAKVAP